MDRDEVIQILSLLAEGTNPETGEVYDHGSPYQSPRIIRALFHAVRLLEGNGNIQATGDVPKKERKYFEVPPLDESGKELQGLLRKWRTETARTMKLPAYVILDNKAIAHIAYLRPKTLVQLQKAHGVGLTTVEKYGESILKIMQEHDMGGSSGEATPGPGDAWAPERSCCPKRRSQSPGHARAWRSAPRPPSCPRPACPA